MVRIILLDPLDAEQQLQTLGGTLRHGYRHRPVDLDHRRGRHHRQRAVEGGDLGPVGLTRSGGFGMQRADRSLHLVGSRGGKSKRTVQHRNALADFILIPAGAILFVEQDQLARRIEPRLAPGIVEQHQSQ